MLWTAPSTVTIRHADSRNVCTCKSNHTRRESSISHDSRRPRLAHISGNQLSVLTGEGLRVRLLALISEKSQSGRHEEAGRHEAAKERRRKQKERAASQSSSTQTFVCPKCGRVCTSRTGLYSHQRACKNWPSTFPKILICEEWAIIIMCDNYVTTAKNYCSCCLFIISLSTVLCNVHSRLHCTVHIAGPTSLNTVGDRGCRS